ncbi:vWA domain-containing protein [Arthrobacter russicus]|jgi:Ca-activated chloride channel family protein|uniref:VWFA domain-containing protein n=1 Tax=Arthrobacter russicus TaxID=172040 RepID=A0ABU1J6L1_9MICC|nr:VWA domain-containing protein [Arthrobacter russicus]MDR6268062.1 hypothetical protein [Arthrobacter russicus]
MALVFWWLLPIGAALLLGVLYWAWRGPKRERRRTPVAHADRLTGLPGYRAALARRRLWTGVLAGSALLLCLGALIAASRPAVPQNNSPQSNNRDIMLCLDVSGSMVDADAELVQVFNDLAQNFRGERLGMVIFDSSAVQVFPLTDDYEFVREQLTAAHTAMSDQSKDTGFFDGTYGGKGSSLIGDGLATCVNGFPQTPDALRSRTVVFATDNVLLGRPLFSLDQAAALAVGKSVRVYGINPNGPEATGTKASAARQLQAAVEKTAGAYYPLGDPAAAKDIVAQVQATEARRIEAAPRINLRDQPEPWLAVAGLGLGGLIFGAWRLRR